MYVNRSPGLGSFFTDVRNLAEQAVATYYPALRPLVAKPSAPKLAAPPPPVPTPEAVQAMQAREGGGFHLSTPLMIGGGLAALGIAAFFLLKKKGR